MKLPDPLARRHLLEGTLEAPKALALARAYLEQDREIDAIDFLAVANSGSSGDANLALLKLRTEAMDRGDAFLMQEASRGLKQTPSREDWQRLADAAKCAGRTKDAETALRLATVGD